MDFLKLLQDLAQSIASLQAQLIDAQAAADALAKENYDRGYADGKASVGSDKIYSQAELDAAVAGAVEPLQAQVNDLQLQVAAMQGAMDQKVAEAVAALKADLLAKFQALEGVVTEFENVLK